MKNIIEMFDSLQEDVNQLKKGTLPQETKMIPHNGLIVNLEICTSSSRPQSREDRSQSHDQALLRQSCSPWRHKRVWLIIWTRMKIKERLILRTSTSSQVNSKLVNVSEKTRTFLKRSCRWSLPNANHIKTLFWVTKGCGNKNSTAGLLHKDGGQCLEIY